MDFKTEDIGGTFKIVSYNYFQLKYGVLAGDSFFIEISRNPKPTEIKIHVTISITQGLEPCCNIKSESKLYIKNKTTNISEKEKMFLITSSVNQTIIELEKGLLKDSGMNLGLTAPPENEILKSTLNNISDLN